MECLTGQEPQDAERSPQVTGHDMFLDDVERPCRERTNPVIHPLGSLPATMLQLTTELRAVVHPLRHRRTSHPSSFSGLTVCAAGQQHIDSEMLRVGQSRWSALVRPTDQHHRQTVSTDK